MNKQTRHHLREAKEQGWFFDQGAGIEAIDNFWDWCSERGTPFIKVTAARKNGYAVIDFLACGWFPSTDLAVLLYHAMGWRYLGGRVIREHSIRVPIPEACAIASELARIIKDSSAEQRLDYEQWKESNDKWLEGVRFHSRQV